VVSGIELNLLDISIYTIKGTGQSTGTAQLCKAYWEFSHQNSLQESTSGQPGTRVIGVIRNGKDIHKVVCASSRAWLKYCLILAVYVKASRSLVA
jgi:hypothetical protein